MAGKKQDQKMTFTQHLGEFKKCLVVIVAVFAIAFVVCYIYAPNFVETMMSIDIGRDISFTQTDPTELLAQYIKVALIAALVIDSPVIIWQVHSFVSPGLTKSEDTKFLTILIGGLLFFAIGDVFCYFIVIPFTLKFLLDLNSIGVTQLINITNYISYIVALLVAFGCVFEMPVIAAILSAIGLVKPKGMIAARRIVIVICFIIGAAITPPDVMSQCMVGLPMIVLYEISIGVCKVIYNAKRKKLIAQGIDPDEYEDEEEKEKKESKESRWASAKAQVELADARKASKKAKS